MVLSDMDDGESFLDVINENDLFGNAIGPDDDGNSGFNWADEFLSTTGVDDNAANAHVVQNETISPVEVAPLSIQNHIAVQQNVVNAQSYLPQSSAVPAQGVPRSASLGGMQIVQGATGLVQQATATPQTPQINVGQLQQGLGQQIVQSPNGQLILKPGGGGQIFFQTHPQIQSLQTSTTQASSLQQVPGSSQVINRILAPSQSPVSTSPIVSRAITPVTSSHVGRSLTPIQSWAGVNPVTMVTNNANTPQVFTRNIPLQFSNPNAGIQLQGQSAVLQQGQGTILQQGQGQSTILQPTQGSNTLLHQGQGQAAAVLQGQGQNIVNTQNTVIQNPNVVNLNVAHVLCNNSQLQNQSGSTVHHMAPNIQGTLIQTADGKHIIIPNNNVPQTVGGQSINFQNLPQMTIQPQLNIAQNTTSGSNMVFGSTSNLAGNLGNVIRVATQGGSNTPTPTPTPDKTNQPQQPSHYIGVNQQGQQILIQRTNNTAGQQQNIILRTLNPNIVQLSQQQQQQQQPLQTASGIQTTPQIAGTPGTQQVLVSSQAQPQAQGIQLQRIVNTSQGQQVKFISHGGGQAAGMPLTINWQGMQNPTNSAIPTAIHVVPQQQVPKTISSSSDGNDMSVHQQPSSSQVGMVLNSQPITVKSVSNQNQLIQQQHQSLTQSTTPRQTLYSTPSSSKISLSSASTTPQQNTHTSASPHQLVQNLQSVQIPLVSQYSGASATPNLSTASTTTVTTTVTQSRVPVTTTSQSTNQVMSSVQLQQLVAGASQKQNVLQARDSAPKLQHTIQLTPEAQTQLQQIQDNLKKLGGVKNLNNGQKVQRKHLLELQKKILSEGQIIRQTIQNTATPLPQQLITPQPQQSVQFQTQNLIGQNVQLIGQSQNIQAPPHLVIGQQLPKQVIGQGSVIKQEVASFQGSVKDPAQGTMGIVQSQQPPTQFVQATIAAPATQAGNLVIKSEALPTSSLSTMITSSQVSPSVSVSLTQPTTSLPQIAKPSDVKVEQPDPAVQDTSQLVTTGGTQVLMNQLPVGAVHPGVVMAAAPPGKMAISASPKVALPTPIKIGNHTLNLNLTVDQKEKVQGYLSKMTPEQQQQQISLFLKLQRQQQLQAQVNAQVKAQQVLQQKQTLGSALASSSSKLPITVQQLENKATTATKPAEIPALTTPVSTVTTSAIPGFPFAAIPKSQLIHQQLSKDQDNALKPDTKTPFRSRRDTYRRLLRYHVFQCKSPPDDLMEKDHEMFKSVAAGLLHKKQKMFDKFRLLLLKESMRKKKTAEMVMIQRLMNEDLTETIKSEKELVKSNPDSFEAMPLRYLKKQESVKSEDMSMDEQDVSDISKVIKSEKISDSDTVEIKKEQTSRPCTPKVKLVIRSDGQNFTSSLAEDGSSDSNESSYHDNVNMDTSEIERQNSSNSRSDSDDISKSLFGAPHLTNIKTEPVNDESESMESDHWSDSNKPFKLYLASDNSPVSNSDLDTGGYGNSSPSPTCNEITIGEYEVHSGAVGSPDRSARRNSDSPSFEMNEGSVRHLISNDSNCDNNVMGYHSSEKQQLCINSFSEKDLYHSHDYPQQSESSDKQSFKPTFMSDSKVPFSIGKELFDRVVDDSSHSKQHFSNDNELDSAVVDVGGFHQSQYEPISSPEVDHDESFSSLITHKVDSAYTIGMGEHKDAPHISNSDMPFSVPAFSSAQLDVEPRETVEDDEATTLYSDDSDKESDSQQELLKAQMESAINSIVSLNQDSSVHSPFSLDQSNEFFTRHSYMTNPTTESESDTPGPSTPARSVTPEDDPNDVSMDDDLESAVNSILM
ncbi:BRD4-interacting chromatin-remodeling complex-associated protein-like isoform X2 [Pecten maximus]|uniref:BRD4-interacting chromatin-remodeling complex-associated protein-like isoform X1 n=1 Tax=Pecten maximus TaxID=6579 RepID=UPI001458E803|nr:BRD4-interacting chromatin-remodeling complex-associated protein-like isoform X1 [Pecten maximus]XP_033752151.1 BRD4-interacting chromatin-remodeling complex-associated protein-like isoform X2 [Pecten maximus]